MTESHYIVLDCETGGLRAKPGKYLPKGEKVEKFHPGNPIVQIACMTLDAYTLKEVDRFETFVKPYNSMLVEKAALLANGLNMADINKGIDAIVLKKLLIAYFQKHNPTRKKMSAPIFVGQNFEFDLGFLEYLFESVGTKDDLYNYVKRFYHDTWADSKRAYGISKGVKHNLGVIAERLSIEHKNAHNAMPDVITTAEAFRNFTLRLRSEGGVQIDTGVENKKNTKKQRDFFEF
jgi:DNA polymerase III epsilon subunit-like protein